MKTDYIDFRDSLKSDNNYDIVKLLMVQRKLEQRKNDKKEISSLLSNLTEYEKNKLIQLYNNQIRSLNNSINNYKYRIIRERKQIGII